MRLRRRLFFSALVTVLLAAPLAAEEVVTSIAPTPHLSFRGVSFGRDMNLRESTLPAPPSAKTAIISPTAPQPASTPLAKVAKTTAPARKSTTAHKPAATAVSRTTVPSPSILPPGNNPPGSALPEGGLELALQPTTFTPYDRYLGSVRSVIYNLETQPASMLLVARLMKEGRHFRYSVCDPYRADPPAITAARHAGDCKSKALWLYSSLGDSNALFVIGKAQKRMRSSHAWVYWRYDDRWWILDCTERADPIAADSVSSDRYVPYYSFGKSGTFRHKATRLILTSALHPSASPVTGRQ